MTAQYFMASSPKFLFFSKNCSTTASTFSWNWSWVMPDTSAVVEEGQQSVRSQIHWSNLQHYLQHAVGVVGVEFGEPVGTGSFGGNLDDSMGGSVVLGILRGSVAVDQDFQPEARQYSRGVGQKGRNGGDLRGRRFCDERNTSRLPNRDWK